MPAPLEIHLPRSRLDALADGVYAIAVTLLVLELRLPPLGAGVSQAALIQALQGIVPKVLVWLLSFWVAALLWASSVRISRLAGDDGKPTVVLELGQLALVSLLPFSSALMGEHGD
ncbi:MAG TPA: TMEM175 family protein, partial [Rubrivivax sp.]|nr:TMEM175 family protein [Rubrivivax sp.]